MITNSLFEKVIDIVYNGLSTTFHRETKMDTIKIVHIGGRDNIGPADCMLKIEGASEVYLIEAAMEGAARDTYTKSSLGKSKGTTPFYLVEACISDKEGPAVFNINHDPRSSSLFKMASTAEGYVRLERKKKTFPWKLVARTEREINLHTTTLDRLVRDKVIPIPNILSMDIQGAEYPSLVGGKSTLESDDILAVITEAEFRPMYEGQATFGDINNLLLDYDLLFFDFLYEGRWWEETIMDKGFLAVVEALFMKDYRKVHSFDNLIKLAAIAYMFGYSSHGYALSKKAIKTDKSRWGADDPIIRFIREQHEMAVEKDKAFRKRQVWKVEDNS